MRRVLGGDHAGGHSENGRWTHRSDVMQPYGQLRPRPCRAPTSATRWVPASSTCAPAGEDPLSPRSRRGRYQILIFVILWMGSPGMLPKCHLSTVALVAGAPSLGTYSSVTLLSPVQIRSTP